MPSSQFQSIPQMHAPVAGQSWMSSANHGASLAKPVQQTGQQVPLPSSMDTVSAFDAFKGFCSARNC